MQPKNIKVNFSISEDTKKRLDSFKKSNKINMSEMVNNILKFDQKALELYLKYYSEFNNLSNIDIMTSDLICTTNVDKINKFKDAEFLDIEDIKQSHFNKISSEITKTEESKKDLNQIEEENKKLKEKIEEFKAVTVFLNSKIERAEKKLSDRMKYLEENVQKSLEKLISS